LHEAKNLEERCRRRSRQVPVRRNIDARLHPYKPPRKSAGRGRRKLRGGARRGYLHFI
jgi:hypothetical protein